MGFRVGGVGGAHDEVDVRQRVAEAGGAGHVVQSAGPVFAGLEVAREQEVRPGAEVAVVPAELHGRLAGAVVDVDHRRHGAARLLDEVTRHEYALVPGQGAARVQQHRGRFLVIHPHPDLGEDVEHGHIDLPPGGLTQELKAAHL